MSGSFTPVTGECKALPARGLTLETCEKWNYRVGKLSDGTTVQIENFYKNGELVAQHTRDKEKNFKWLGDSKGVELFGQHLWRDGGKKLVVTEGAIDVMTVSQLQSHKWPCVSITSGIGSAVKCFKDNFEWMNRFEEIVILFDNDPETSKAHEQVKKATEECAALFAPGKCKIAKLPLKDANDMLLAGRGAEVIDAIWAAKGYRPDGVVSIKDLKSRLNKPIERGLSYPWPSLTEMTYGIRSDELIALGAGTGMGKSEVWKEVMVHLATEHSKRVGGIFLEETPEHTVRCLAGKLGNKRFHVPDGSWTQEEMDAVVEDLDERDSIFLFDHFGHTDYEVIKARIRYMAVALDCKYIFLDHITALVSGQVDGDERKQLDYIMTDLASLCRELHITIFFISHLSSPEGTPHEEGGRVTIKQFRGSRAIGQWSSFMLALERDQQEQNPKKQHITTVRMLKDRYTGDSTGKLFYLKYDPATGRLKETDAPDEDTPFSDRTSNEKDDF